MTANRGQVGLLVVQVQNAFLDMPKLTLSLAEAGRWFDMDETTCAAIFGALVEAGVLVRRADGTYARYIPRRKAHAA